jgi:hypothetical protein
LQLQTVDAPDATLNGGGLRAVSAPLRPDSPSVAVTWDCMGDSYLAPSDDGTPSFRGYAWT